MKTRKELTAENTELKAKLAVHDHVTRKALNEFVKGQAAHIQALKEQNAKQAKELEALKAKPAEEVAA